ncbi:MAG: outer membrane beta-barrel protein [Planctomycetaceae bacterium]|nr:outer membrane beta-barrel protein [Planctomycetaceae bacterium]
MSWLPFLFSNSESLPPQRGYSVLVMLLGLFSVLVFRPASNAQSGLENFKLPFADSEQEGSTIPAPLPPAKLSIQKTQNLQTLPFPPQMASPLKIQDESREDSRNMMGESREDSSLGKSVPLPTPSQHPVFPQSAIPPQQQSNTLTPQQQATLRMLGQQSGNPAASPYTPSSPQPYPPIYPATAGWNPYLAGNSLASASYPPYVNSPYNYPNSYWNPSQVPPFYNPSQGMEEEQNSQSGTLRQQEQYEGSSSAFTNSPYMPIRSPLLETTVSRLKLMNPFNAPTGTHRNVGQPLENESWLDHPWYVGVFGGCVFGGPLVDDVLKQKSGGNGGLMFGKNFNHYWGLEARALANSIDLKDFDGISRGSSKLSALDVSVHYYPYGEARWRPFLKLGFGTLQETFLDQEIKTWSIPVGVGVKYFWSNRFAVQADIVDNIILGKGPTKMHGEISFNFGISYMFGTNPDSHPTVYWPYTTSLPY